jgi:hypothetical protein
LLQTVPYLRLWSSAHLDSPKPEAKAIVNY